MIKIVKAYISQSEVGVIKYDPQQDPLPDPQQLAGLKSNTFIHGSSKSQTVI